MAEEKKKSIFRVESEDNIHPQEKLNEYIRIGSTGSYMMIAALAIIAAALIIWGFVGKIPVTITEYGGVARASDYTNTCICFVDVHQNTGVIPVGNKATLHMADGTSYDGHISYMSALPQSSDELRGLHGPAGESEAGHFSEWVLNYYQKALQAFQKVEMAYDLKLNGWPYGKTRVKFLAGKGPHAAGIFLASK